MTFIDWDGKKYLVKEKVITFLKQLVQLTLNIIICVVRTRMAGPVTAVGFVDEHPTQQERTNDRR